MFKFGEYEERPALMDEDVPIAIFEYQLSSLDEIDEMIEALRQVKENIENQIKPPYQAYKGSEAEAAAYQRGVDFAKNAMNQL